MSLKDQILELAAKMQQGVEARIKEPIPTAKINETDPLGPSLYPDMTLVSPQSGMPQGFKPNTGKIGKFLYNIPVGVVNNVVGKGIIAPAVDASENFWRLILGKDPVQYEDARSGVTRLGYQAGGVINPDSRSTFGTKTGIKQTLGNVAEAAEPILNAYIPEKAVGTVGAAKSLTAIQGLAPVVKQGATQGLKFGALYGLDTSLAQNRNTQDDTQWVGNVAAGTAVGAGSGALIGGTLAGITYLLTPKTIKAISDKGGFDKADSSDAALARNDLVAQRKALKQELASNKGMTSPSKLMQDPNNPNTLIVSNPERERAIGIRNELKLIDRKITEINKILEDKTNGFGSIIKAVDHSKDKDKGVTLYHGTSSDFNPSDIKPGSYLTADKEYAGVYQSPSASSIHSSETLANKRAGSPRIIEYKLSPKAKVFDITNPDDAKLLNDYWGKSSVSDKFYPSNTGQLDWTEGENVAEYLQSKGYKFDGIKIGEGGGVTPEGNVIRRSDSIKILNPKSLEPVIKKVDPNAIKDPLVTTHNIRAEGVVHADKMGGLPVPSLAISKADHPIEGFGDITLVGDKELINPATKSNKVFDADAYSPRYPKVTYTANKNASKFLEPIAKKAQEVYGDGYNNSVDSWLNQFEEGGAAGIADSSQTKRAFWAANNSKGDTGTADIYQFASNNSDKYDQFVKNIVDNISGTEKLFKGFTYSGSRRYVPHTLENVVKEMKGTAKDSEGFNYGLGSLRASQSKQYKTLSQIQSDRNRILPMDQINQDRVKSQDEFNKISSSWTGDMSDTLTNLKDFMSGKVSKSELKQYPSTQNLTDKQIQEFVDFTNKLKTGPSPYFEAKPQRAVGLNEFKGALVPENVSKATKDILEKNGLKIVEYNDKIPGDKVIKLKDNFGNLFYTTLGALGLMHVMGKIKTGDKVNN